MTPSASRAAAASEASISLTPRQTSSHGPRDGRERAGCATWSGIPIEHCSTCAYSERNWRGQDRLERGSPDTSGTTADRFLTGAVTVANGARPHFEVRMSACRGLACGEADDRGEDDEHEDAGNDESGGIRRGAVVFHGRLVDDVLRFAAMDQQLPGV